MSHTTGAILLVVLYFAVIFVKALRLRRGQDASPVGYFLGGRSLGPGVLVMTIAASFFSMYSFMGAYGITWRIGMNFLNQGWWMLMFLSWGGVFVGARVWLLGRRFGFITPADLLAHYYDSSVVRALVVVLGILILFPYAAIQFSGVGKMIEGFSEGAISYELGVAVFLGFTASYTLVSGMRGVAWTDVLQGALFAVVMFAALGWVSLELGGPAGIVQQVERVRPELFDFDQGFAWFLNLSITWGIGFAVLPHIWQRWYAADSLATVYRSSWVVGVVSWALCLPIFFIGLAAHVLLPDLTVDQSDALFPLLMSRYLPTLGMFVVPAAFAAAMSTVDSMLLSISSSVENDVYARLRPGASDAQRARVGKRFVLGFAALLMVFAISDIGRSFIVPIGNASASLALVLVPPLVGPLYWPRGTRAGAVTALAAGSAFMLATLIPAVRAALLPEHGLLSFSATTGLLFTAAVYGGVSLVTSPVPYETQAAYHGTLERVLEGTADP